MIVEGAVCINVTTYAVHVHHNLRFRRRLRVDTNRLRTVEGLAVVLKSAKIHAGEKPASRLIYVGHVLQW